MDPTSRHIPFPTPAHSALAGAGGLEAKGEEGELMIPTWHRGHSVRRTDANQMAEAKNQLMGAKVSKFNKGRFQLFKISINS